ncbi:MAG: ribosome-associated translation inhibitor RaiA [Bacilli bacterium]|nr:ribosome-associated translation inhibitor RaiA [Bacilli bacterium]MDD4607904.1 ribosome-associated translation inhibitor RaiA [Bacilli bacterium]
MKFNIRGNKITITEPIKGYIEEKIGKLDKYFENPSEITANVVARVNGYQQIVEVTIPAKKIILRGEEEHDDLYAAIDLVSEKIERQIQKNKTRMHHKNNRVNTIDFNFDYEISTEEDNHTIVKRKQLELKPMSEEEAILQMNLLGHSFFVFEDAKTEKISVLYQRKDGNYGIIETK